MSRQDNLTMDTVKGILEDLMADRLPKTVAEQFSPLKKQMEKFLSESSKAVSPFSLGGEGEAGKPNDAGSKAADGKAFNGVGDFAMAVYKSETTHNLDSRLKDMVSKAPLGASEAVGADGGFLVQQDIASDIFRRIHETGILLKDTGIRRVPIGSNSNGLDIPAIDESSRTDGSRWGGVQIFRAAEGVSGAPKRPKYRLIQLRLKKMLGFTYVTDELLQDSVALGTILQEAFAEEFGYKMDQEIFKGTGADGMLGIMNSPSLVSVSAETGQKTKTIVTENILNMWSRVWGRSWPNVQWFINQDTLPQLGQMSLKVGTGGIPVYMPAGGLSGQPYGMLFGRPVKPLEQAPTLGTMGDITALDLSQYVMIEKGGIRGDVSMHLKFDTAELAFRWMLRNDGQPLWNAPLTPASGSANTLSPFVALANR
jgi:HK97 family phage major capsid protein